MNPQLGKQRLVAIGDGAHAIEVELFELGEQLVGQTPRFRKFSLPALLVVALGLTNLLVGGRQWPFQS
jgi:hypothetical protein